MEQCLPLTIFSSCSLGGGGRYFSVPSRKPTKWWTPREGFAIANRTAIANSLQAVRTRVRFCTPIDALYGNRGNLSVATPAEPRGKKQNFFLCKFWAVTNF